MEVSVANRAYDPDKNPPFFPVEMWLNSPLSVTRFFGACTYNGVSYVVDELTEDLCREDVIAERRAAYTPEDLAKIKAKYMEGEVPDG
jgi:hypothetical protein